MFGEIVFITSVRVRLSAARRFGSTVTMYAGCCCPWMITSETPGTCSITGTMPWFAIAPRIAAEYLCEVSANVMTTS